MDSYEAARAVFSRIQSVDPDNASKIIAFILLQDQAEKEMIRLAFGPENLIHSVVNVAKTELGLSSSTSSAPNSSPLFSPVSNPISISRPTPRSLSLPSPRLAHNGFNPSSPSSPSIWSVSASSNHHSLSPDSNHSPSYAAVVNGAGSLNGSLPSPLGSSQPTPNRLNFADDYHFQEQNLSFLNDPLAPPAKNVDFLDQSFEMASSPGSYWENGVAFENEGQLHRRSCSMNDDLFGSDDSTTGFGYKNCLYFAKGFCKNGTTCNFVHGGGFVDSGDHPNAIVGSPCKLDALEQCQQELLRSKVVQQQRLAAAQYMASVNFPYNKLNFLQNEAQRSTATALMMGEDLHKLNRFRLGRNEFPGLGCGDSNPSSKQIYLTFPADSTFKEEDVSNYFSIYGPVQDVRIPYQQKRMFGFVTFVYPGTVKIILAKGNPHFVCDSRVLVKPYKEKGKLLDKKQHQLDRSEFSSCGSPSGLDCREPFEMHVGPRMFQNNQEMMLRKKLEQEADWQQALEFQSRKLMNLQLLDLKSRNLYQQNVPVGSSNDPLEGDMNMGSPNGSPSGHLKKEMNAGIINEDNPKYEGPDLPESMEHILPDSLFASPTKFVAEERSAFGTTSTANDNNNPVTPPTSALNIPSFKSCFVEIPRISPGHEAIRM